MVTDAFGLILQELGTALKIGGLKPDANNSCLIKFPQISIQLELDSGAQNLILCSNFPQIPPGKYRENVFREALKANGLPYPHAGDFAYSKQADHLVLMKSIPLKELTGEKVFQILTPFMQRAIDWNESLSRGEIPSIQIASSGIKTSSGMFGLK